MKLHKITIQGKGAFATIPKGDTLFGQCCWAIRERYGKEHLVNQLDGYTQNHPFLIISDFLPENTISKPPVPLSFFDIRPEAKERKDYKRRTVIRIQDLKNNGWVLDKQFLEDEHKVFKENELYQFSSNIRVRNTIDRLTDTTGKGFSPFSNYAYQYTVNKDQEVQYAQFSIYVLIDTDRIQINEIELILEQIGVLGFGKDANVGRGKFTVLQCEEAKFLEQGHNSLITLSPSVLYGVSHPVFYKPFTRFGKHGAQIHGSQIWKNPILMADSFALIRKADSNKYIGKGLGGNAEISNLQPETVHQGYAITMPIILREEL